MEEKIVEYDVDLSSGQSNMLNESWLNQFGTIVKMMIEKMFGYHPKSMFKIRGTRSQLDAFSKTLSREKSYMESFLNSGLNDPKTFENKWRLDASVKQFEKETGIKWPIK